ncbi:hypothetical protein COCON_G00062940 [Conger conger]|uniref:Chemokine interleukin-8-like domain-containing protein n=1 Tax=Conger conger TaxID=82655 RepID=A0A9Q1I3R7_CONCO|nr:hypothetical protein COCON_G00062940 [Conger conger]
MLTTNPRMRISVAAAPVLLLLSAASWMPLVSATSRSAPDCCLKILKKQLPKNRIVDYREQRAGPCPVNAIQFQTKKEKWGCANPESPWVKAAMRMVEDRKKAKATNKASSAKSKKGRQGRKGRRRRLRPAPPRRN